MNVPDRRLQVEYNDLCRRLGHQAKPRAMDRRSALGTILKWGSVATAAALGIRGCQEAMGSIPRNEPVRDRYDVLDLTQYREQWNGQLLNCIAVRNYDREEVEGRDPNYPYLQDTKIIKDLPIPTRDADRREWITRFIDDSNVSREVRSAIVRRLFMEGTPWENDYGSSCDCEECTGWMQLKRLSQPLSPKKK